MSAAIFAAAAATLYAAHQAGDYWVQTSPQAARKGLPGWPGRRACAAAELADHDQRMERARVTGAARRGTCPLCGGYRFGPCQAKPPGDHLARWLAAVAGLLASVITERSRAYDNREDPGCRVYLTLQVLAGGGA